MAKIFIDGQVGTTGLEITSRLAHRSDLVLLEIDEAVRKNEEARRACLQQADVAILCLPDAAAQAAVALADGQTRILDASTAYRTDPDWVYGLAELCPEQRQLIAAAQYVSNPGCYPQGFILLTRPLIDAGVLSADTPLRCHAVSGYSGGGRQMIERFQAFDATEADALNSQTYALNLTHKHVPEMAAYSGSNVRPLFSPMVANYYKGMLVHVPLFTQQELNGATPGEIQTLLEQRYAGEPFIEVMPLNSEPAANEGFLNPTRLNNTNRMQLMVYGHDDQIMLIARYDNLGKGAAGAAVQNLNIMLGIEEQTGL